jgi:hypothetical protein
MRSFEREWSRHGGMALNGREFSESLQKKI